MKRLVFIFMVWALVGCCGGEGGNGGGGSNDTPSTAKQPSNLKADPGDKKVILSWDETPAASSYNLQWVLDASAGAQLSLTHNEESNVKSPHEVSGLTNDATYKFKIEAVSGPGIIGSTDWVAATPRADFHAVTIDMNVPASRVTSTPAGIDCGRVCIGTFPHGTAVTLTVTRKTAGSFFTGPASATTSPLPGPAHLRSIPL